jgi:hypothetical protein
MSITEKQELIMTRSNYLDGKVETMDLIKILLSPFFFAQKKLLENYI